MRAPDLIDTLQTMPLKDLLVLFDAAGGCSVKVPTGLTWGEIRQQYPIVYVMADRCDRLITGYYLWHRVYDSKGNRLYSTVSEETAARLRKIAEENHHAPRR